MTTKKERKQIPSAKVYISASFNNTIVTVTDLEGNTLAWGSSGAAGFKGARKATPYAASTAVESLTRKLSDAGVRDVEIYVKGPGAGRDAAIRAFRNSGLSIKAIADVTPIPHNGPKPRKRRRV
ncbi:MAG: 30S ribosomal protein S11 [Candidatus Woykebacteria bacterium RIFCSPHIGHO2_12_FULL_45_10]|uniref:Small ribosomal subunit protein uS11 n=1 Tax=Candidatus Woykebacteria bacterium RIFCSPHIGHO2_12_FULL_45_10 TaxID=1802603 RepID=A0A1G1WNH3_9BACT|nr:MAG: 30S ribosomal protein S11 [Candidatus Woykebacteria bacterium RIFCSPHIGHO2_12_FULL_45_10]